MHIIVINGFPRTGKDEFFTIAKKYLKERITQCSTVDLVKAYAETMGWDGQKTPKNRKFLSDLKNILTQWDDIPFKDISHQIEYYRNYLKMIDEDESKSVFIVHSREPREIQRFKDEFGAKALLIRRPSVEQNEYSCDSDNNVLNFDYDYTIYNDSTLENYEQKIVKLLDIILGGEN